MGHLSEVGGSWIVFSFFDFCASFGLMGMKHLAPPIQQYALSLSLSIHKYFHTLYIFVIYIWLYISLSLEPLINACSYQL